MFMVILIIGLGLIVNGVLTLSSRVKLIPMSKVITGTVVNMQATPANRNRTAYYPVIEYCNPDTNEAESFKHEVANGRSKYNIGDTVELRYYDNGERKLVLINTWSGMWLTPIISMIAGAIFAAFGVMMRLMP